MEKNPWSEEYSVLDKEDLKDPIVALFHSCGRDSLFNLRHETWEMFHAANMSPYFEGDTPDAKGDLCYLYHSLLELAEIAFRINEMVMTKRLLFAYAGDDKLTPQTPQP